MRRIRFRIVIAVFLCHNLNAQENITFTGHIINPKGNIISLSNIWGESYDALIDSIGGFTFSFENNSGGFFNLSYNSQLILVNLSPDGNLNVKFDYEDIDNTIKYYGKNAEFNKALYKLSRGKPAPDFILPSIDGEEISLSEFKGQYVYIDVWTSYCGGCIKEVPYFEKLKEEFSNKDIVFISISGDTNRNRWVRALKKNNLTGIQLINEGFKAEFSAKYLNYGSPRYILIDEKQRIINANANKPSDIGKILDELSEL